MNQRKELIIAAGYGTTNVGDIALLVGTVKLLQACDPSARISSLSWCWKDPSRCEFLADLERATGSSCEFLGAVISGNVGRPYAGSSGLRRSFIALQAGWSNFGPELARCFPIMFRLMQHNRSSDNLYRRIAKARCVVLRGCNLTVRNGRLRDILGLRRTIFPLLLAQQAGIPTAILNVTVGPLDSHYACSLIIGMLQRAQFVSCREENTYKYLQDLGIKEVQRGADSAFLLESPMEKQPHPGQVAVNILSPAELRINSPKGYTYDQFVSEYARALDAIVTQLGVDLLFIPHESAVFRDGNDLQGIEMILERMNSKSRARVAPVTLLPQQIVDYYAECQILIGCRYHGIILGAVAGVPAINIDFGSYKVQGIAKMLGLSEYLVDVPINPQRLVESVRMGLARLNVLRRLQTDRVRDLRRLAGEPFRAFFDSLNERSK